ncbi:hypothetical protein RSA31_22690, partial [Pantoea dispersa]
MSGVVAAMRRTLLSCTSLARDGMLGLAMSALLPARSSFAAEGLVAQAMSEHFGFNHQEVAVLATSFALVGFS